MGVCEKGFKSLRGWLQGGKFVGSGMRRKAVPLGDLIGDMRPGGAQEAGEAGFGAWSGVEVVVIGI